MKKFYFLFCVVFLVCQGISAQQRYFEVKDESSATGVFSGLDNEAGVIIACNQNKILSFDSSMDKTVTIFKQETEGSNTLYYLVFKVGRKYKGRVLSVICPGFTTAAIPLDLTPKQLKRFLLYDPNDVVDGGCYQQHRVKGMQYFDNASYKQAKEEFTLSLQCTDCNKEEASQKIQVCDSILVLRELADKQFDLLKYGEASANYHKIQAYNPQDKYVINRIFECNQSQDIQSASYFAAAEQYFKDKDYDKARILYQRVVNLSGTESVNASLKISEIDRQNRRSINRERVLSYEYESKAPIGFSYGSYGAHSHGYFTLRINNELFDLARGEYKMSKKPEANMSFGWTINVVKKYGWIFFGPGVTMVGKYQVNPDKWGDATITTDKQAETITEEQVLAKVNASTDGKEEKDFLKVKPKFAVSPEIGFLVKYGPVALRYTFQYRWAIAKDDQDWIGKIRNVIGIGFAF